jgi:hypothetical protein
MVSTHELYHFLCPDNDRQNFVTDGIWIWQDAVSRKISLDTLVEFAVAQGSQWIFITPHDIRSVDSTSCSCQFQTSRIRICHSRLLIYVCMSPQYGEGWGQDQEAANGGPAWLTVQYPLQMMP